MTRRPKAGGGVKAVSDAQAVGHLVPTVEILIQSALWQGDESEQVVRDAITVAAAMLALQTNARSTGELAVVLTDDASIRELNRCWRGIDRPTNVLSFEAPRHGSGPHALLGDVVIAFETAAREAIAEGKPLTHHVAHLAVHGFLHLMGHDHESEDEALSMERLEREILARLDIPDPYGPET
jgi:probable rRNA maturation factor